MFLAIDVALVSAISGAVVAILGAFTIMVVTIIKAIHESADKTIATQSLEANQVAKAVISRKPDELPEPITAVTPPVAPVIP